MVSLSPSTTFSSLSFFFSRPGLPGPFFVCFRPSRCFSLFCRCFPRPSSVLRYFAPFSAFLPPPSVSSFPFCHSEEGPGPPKNLFSARFVSRPRASLSRPPLPVILSTPPCHSERSEESVSRLRRTPPLRRFRPALPTARPPGRPPHARTPPLQQSLRLGTRLLHTPPQKNVFFEGVSALFLSEIPLILVVPTPLQNIYFCKYILSYNNYLYARKHCTRWRGFSRGWRGVFERALFQRSARAPKRLFVGVFSAPE